MMEKKMNIVGWFEIPVIDMERAIKFYETVFDVKLNREPMGPFDMAFFPRFEDGLGAAGALVFQPDNYKPSTNGPLIYFTPRSIDLNVELNRVEAAGGKIISPKTLIKEEIGYMALFLDTEGNRLALHSRS
ncbi:VOC family protein [Marinilabiliaceae bacterium JC017]|nr:VOC family protein [Marinilabiliaceae bacterium JC017]